MEGAWRHFRLLPPGSRFHESYLQHQRKHQRQHKRPASRLAILAGAFALIFTGIVALVTPGPGLLMIALGAGLVARESAKLSRSLDRFELWLRRRFARGDARSQR